MQSWKQKIVLFLSSQSISMFGSSIVQYAILWHITLSTQSGIMMTLYIICGFLPTFFLSPFAGVWADRYNRKKLIMLADGMIALATLILALLYMAGHQYLWLLFVIAAIRALGAAIQSPAVGAVMPQIVPEDKLIRVNGINGSLQAAIMFVSPMVSAALLSIATLEIIFFVDVITALLAIIVLIFLKLNKQQSSGVINGYFADFKAGLSYIASHHYLRNLLIFFAALFFLMAPAAFLPPLHVARVFGSEVWLLTAIELAFSIGMMIGGGIIAAWGGMKNHIHTIVIGGVVFSLCTLAFGLIPTFIPYVTVMFICGVAMPLFNTPTMTLIQEKVAPEYLGRIFGIIGMISSSMMPIGMLVFGPLSDYMEIEILFIITGVFMLLLIALFGRDKALLEAGKKAMPSTNDIT